MGAPKYSIIVAALEVIAKADCAHCGFPRFPAIPLGKTTMEIKTKQFTTSVFQEPVLRIALMASMANRTYSELT